MDFLNIMQWNAQSLNSNKQIFTNFLYTNNIHIAIISETWLKPHQQFKIKYYNVERNDCGNNHNGVAILIHNSINYTNINTYFDNSLQNICTRITINKKAISILSFYSPSNSDPAFSKLKLDALVKSIPEPLILAGDFNAHHTSWGCGSDTPRGREVLEIIDDNNLVLLNDGQPTTIGSLTWRANALDLSLVSPSLALQCKWSVLDIPLGTSYHIPAIITVFVNNHTNDLIKCNDKHLPIYPNFKLVDWKVFSNNVDNLLVDFEVDGNQCPGESYNHFCKILRTAVAKSCCSTVKVNSVSRQPQSCLISRKKPSIPWWNQKCSDAVLNFKEAYLNFKYDPTEENYLEFKRLRALKKLIIKLERQKSWVSLCESFNRCTPISLIWKFIRKFNKTYVANNDKGDTWILDFLMKYTPDFVSHSSNTLNSDSLNPNNLFLLNSFSTNELKSAVVSRRDTAFGLDGIPYIVFKKLSSKSLEVFLKILNLLWENNVIPLDWKIDCLIPVLKPNKPKLCPDSYRPIALTSCVGKIFEQLLKQRLEFYVEQNKILPSNQFGFRRNHSARESICQLQLDIHNSLAVNNNLIAVFFDVAGAFNSVNIDVLGQELLGIKIPAKIVNWVQAFLRNREVFVKYNRHLYGPRLSSVGVSQGGILSPLIFILYIRRLNLILGSYVKNLQFADDLVVYASGANLTQVAEIVNDALTKLNKYFSYLDLNVNPSKSKVIVFGKRRIINMPVIHYNNMPLPVSLEVKFLGVLFSNNLSWNNYSKHIINKANKAYNILKSLSGSYWGADPKILLTLYKSLVRSHFEYGYFCYGSDVKIVNTINVFQNKCLRLISGAFRSTPISALQVECRLPPIAIRLNYLKERFILKLYSVFGNSLLINLSSAQPSLKPIFMLQGLQSSLNFLRSLNIYQSSRMLPCYEGSFHSKFPAMNIVINNDLSTKEDVYVMLSEWIDHKFIYTDGSKNDDAVAFAIFEPSSNIGVGHKIDKHASVFTAEAVAILSALKHITNRNLGHAKWVVVSDSMSVLRNLANNKLHANTNFIIYLIKQLWVELSDSNINVSFAWVPSHKGVEGNEKADYLANTIVKFANTIASTVANSDADVSLPYTDVVSILKQRMCQAWGRHLYNCTQVENKGSWYSALDVQIDSIPWFCKSRFFLNRKFYSTICRLRFGHCRLNYHLHRLKMVNSPRCDYCQSQEIQSINHIFFECSSFSIQRLVLIDGLLQTYGKSELVPRCIMELLKNSSNFEHMYKFIVSTVTEI